MTGRAPTTGGAGCFLCDAVAAPDDPESLVVHAAADHVVLLNRFPYASGHLMVAPRRHVALPEDADATARAELWELVLHSRRILEKCYDPDGMNLGMNLGRAAGAGAPEHYHFHLVPRWSGDTNFMTATGGVRMVPEEPESAWGRLRSAFAGEEGA